MTLFDLIDKLQDLQQEHGEEDIKVMTSSDYGDHIHTEQLSNIKSIEICVPFETAYSQTGLAFPRDTDLGDGEGEEVVVLRFKF